MHGIVNLGSDLSALGELLLVLAGGADLRLYRADKLRRTHILAPEEHGTRRLQHGFAFLVSRPLIRPSVASPKTLRMEVTRGTLRLESCIRSYRWGWMRGRATLESSRLHLSHHGGISRGAKFFILACPQIRQHSKRRLWGDFSGFPLGPGSKGSLSGGTVPTDGRAEITAAKPLLRLPAQELQQPYQST